MNFQNIKTQLALLVFGIAISLVYFFVMPQEDVPYNKKPSIVASKDERAIASESITTISNSSQLSGSEDSKQVLDSDPIKTDLPITQKKKTEQHIANSPATEIENPTPTVSPIIFIKKIHPEFWIWFGGGMNFQYYKQSVPSINGDATFQNIQGPTTFLNAGSQGETWGLDLSYKETPGKMSSSDTVIVTNGKYNWRKLSVETLYRTNNNWNYRFGIQHHLMPFMALNATTAVLDVKSNSLTMLTLGFNRNFPISNKLRGEWQMHYQHPLLTGSTDGTSFSVNPKFAFDGSIGSVYSLNETSRIGLFWYGQWHQYSFSYGNGINKFSGNQTLFYSNLEVRIGFEF